MDSHNFPNLCLMKLSEYHTRRGDRVEWWSPKGRYDLVYKSRVFTDTYSQDTIVVNNADQVIRAVRAMGRAARTSPMRSSTSGRTTFVSAVFGNGLRLFEPGLSEELRILHRQRQGGTQERQSR